MIFFIRDLKKSFDKNLSILFNRKINILKKYMKQVRKPYSSRRFVD
jgi:hypothetical protein